MQFIQVEQQIRQPQLSSENNANLYKNDL